MFSIFKFSLKGFAHKKARTVLSVLGVAVSSASLMIISMLASVGTQSVNAELDSMGLRGISVESGEILDESALEIISKIDGVECATPVLGLYGSVGNSSESRSAYIWGIDEYAETVISAETVFGRAVEKSDIVAMSDVCLIDRKLSKELFGVENSVGESVVLNFGATSAEYEIVGICESDSGILKSVSGTLAPYFVYAPYTSVRLAQNSAGFGWIAVRANQTNTDEVCSAISNAFKAEQMSVTVEDVSSQRAVLDNLLSIVTVILAAIGAVSLVVSGLSIMTVMLTSVGERTVEIGIKKAIGARSRAILSEFLLEALTISLFGGIIGSVLGMIISATVSYFVLGAISFNVKTFLLCVGISALIGTLFGSYPAYKASKLKPVDALNSD